MYTAKKIMKTVKTSDYLSEYVDINSNLNYCIQCPNYNRNWACPVYDFNVEEIFKKYRNLDIYAVKIDFDSKDVGDKLEGEAKAILRKSLDKEKRLLHNELLSKESSRHNSKALIPNQCKLCKGCSRITGGDCVYPNKSRYSFEGFGGDLEKTASGIFNIPMKWVIANKIPEYTIIFGGLLY